MNPRDDIRPTITSNTESGNTSLKWLVLLAVGVGTFMSALDSSVVNIILPVVRDTFNSDVATVEWIVTVYLLVVSGLLLSFGRLGDMRGHKLIYVFGFGIFIIGSMLSGLSITAPMLVLFRVVQAVGAAMLFANSPAILTRNFPGSQRGQALGIQATMTYLGLTVGPSLGGWLATQLGWRTVFYINVPIGLLALLLSLRFIPQDASHKRAQRFDLVGAVLVIAGLVTLLLGFNQGAAWGWTSLPVLVCFIAALIAMALFVIRERRVADPMLDLNLFNNRQFSAATISAVINYVCINSLIFVLPFYLIQGRNLSTAEAGLLLTAQPLIMAIAAPLSGTLSDRIGPRVLSTLGMVTLGAGVFLLSRLNADSSSLQVASGLAIAGLGTGVFISPNSSALMGSAPGNRQGIAAGIMASARNVGMVLGVGLAGAVLTSVMGPVETGISNAILIKAVSAALVVASGISIIGVITSAVRGKPQERES